MAAATASQEVSGPSGVRRRRTDVEPLPPPVASRGLPEGSTPLMYACQQGKEQEVRRILATKPGSASDRDRTLKTALHYCAENSSPACASALLQTCPSLIDSVDEEGYTAIHLAVISGNRALLRLLIERGADVGRMDREGHSAVHWATVCGEVEALEMVIAAGTNPSTPDIHGGYPVHYAAQMCGANSASASADPRVGLAVLRRLLAHKVKVDVVDKDGRQPILWAASAGSADAIIALVHAGATVEAHDKDGLTALHCAASRGHTDCLETLVTLCGAEVDVIDANGCTALFYATTLGHADSTRLLLGFGAQPNRQDRKGRTAAHCGAAKGQLETLRLLGAVGGADLWIRNVKGDLPLHEAVQSGRRELVRWLLQQRPAAVNASNNDGRCPLHVAAIHNNVEMCKVLLDSHSLVNPVMRTPRGQMATPLDTALLRGNRGCAKFLQLHGGVPASKLTEESARLHGGGPRGVDGGSPADMYLDPVAPTSARDPEGMSRNQLLPQPATGHDTPPDGFRSDPYGGSISRATMYPDGHTTAASFRTTEDKFIQVNDDIAIQYVERIKLSENDGDQEEDIEEVAVLRGKVVSQRRIRGGEEGGVPGVRSRREETGEDGGRRKGGGERKWSRGGECIREEEEEEEESEEESLKRKKRKRTTRKTTRKERSRKREERGGSDDESRDVLSEEEFSVRRGSKKSANERVDRRERVRSSEGEEVGSRRRSRIPRRKSSQRSGEGHSSSPEKSEKDERYPATKIPMRIPSGKRIPVEEQAASKKTATKQLQSSSSTEKRRAVKEASIARKSAKGERSSEAMSQRQKTIRTGKESTTETEDKETDRETRLSKGKIDTPRTSRNLGDGAETERMRSPPPSDEGLTDDDSPVLGSIQGTTREVVAIVHKEYGNGGTSDDEGVIEEEKVKESVEEEDELDEGVVVEGPSEKEEQLAGKVATTDGTLEVHEGEPEVEEETQDGVDATLETKEVLSGEEMDSGVAKDSKDFEVVVKEEDVKEREEKDDAVTEETEDDANEGAGSNLVTASEMDNEETARADDVEARKLAAVAKIETGGKAASESEDVVKDRTEDDFSQLAEDVVSMSEQAEAHEASSKDEGISSYDAVTGARTESQEESEMQDLDGSAADGGASTAEADVSIETIVAAGDRKAIEEEYDEDELPKEQVGTPRETEDTEAKKLSEDLKDKEGSSIESSIFIPSLPLETPSSSSRAAEDSMGPESKGGFHRGRVKEQQRGRIGVRVEIGGRGESNLEDEERQRSRKGKEMPTTSVTQAVQNTVRKYHLERHIFSQLLEMKRLQIRAGRANENVLVKRLVDNFHGQAGSDLTIGINRYEGHYTFRSFEKYLYDQLRHLQLTDPHLIPKLKSTDDMEKLSSSLKRTRATTAMGGTASDNPAMCTQVTHRCHHATHAYTGIPCAAYITKGGGHHHHDHHLHPQTLHHSLSPHRRTNYQRSTATGSFLPKIEMGHEVQFGGGGSLHRSHKFIDPSHPVTLELNQRSDKRQVISLPTQKIDKPKRYLVTFTIKPGSGTSEGVTITTKEGKVKVGPVKEEKTSSPASESPESDSFRHRHAKSL